MWIKQKFSNLLSRLEIHIQKILRNLAIFFFVSLLATIIYKCFFPQQWFFTVTAKSNIVDLITPKDKETKWRLQGAVICSRFKLDLSGSDITSRRSKDSHCGGSKWIEYSFNNPETVLKLNGAIKIHLEVRPDNSLSITLRSTKNKKEIQPDLEDKASAYLSFTDKTPDISLMKNDNIKINIFWPEEIINKNSNYIFPFAGSTTIGQDISWSGTRMLESGEIQVYTADRLINKHQLIDERTLLPGDQVTLLDTNNDTSTAPKGFVRFLAGQNNEDKLLLDVVAFGTADFVRVKRYGNNDYDFKPGSWAQLLYDPVLILLASILILILSLTDGIITLFGKK